MAKKNSVSIQNEELKPQVIGYLRKKKSNIGRAIIIFIAFVIAILYLPEITVFINDHLGMETSPNVKDEGTKDDINTQHNSGDEKEIVYNELSESLSITEGDLILNGFSINGNVLSFNATNNSEASLDLTHKNYFLENYNENKTLLERFKVDFAVFGAKKSQTMIFNVNKSDIKYVTFVEKSIDDYPVTDLKKDEQGISKLACKNDYRTINYTFKNNELVQIKDEVTYNFRADDVSYTEKYNKYQLLSTNYNLMEGAKSSFNSSINGFAFAVELDLSIVKMNKIDEKFYYNYKEEPKVINFEMQTYGFTCS